MVTREQRGFTLVETVVVLAITGLLLVIVLRGFGTARASAQYSQAVDAAKESFSQFKTASLASINVNEAGNVALHQGLTGSGVPCHILIGQAASFVPNSSTINLHQIDSIDLQNADCGVSDSPLAGVPVAYNNIADPSAISLKWGLTYIGYQIGSGPLVTGAAAKYFLLFSRNYIGGSLLVSAAGALPTNDAAVLNAQITAPISFYFQSPSGQRASITVDASGGITRVFH